MDGVLTSSQRPSPVELAMAVYRESDMMLFLGRVPDERWDGDVLVVASVGFEEAEPDLAEGRVDGDRVPEAMQRDLGG